jgi:hypothetical protein
MSADDERPWLLDLASERPVQEPEVDTRYDAASQMTRLQEPDIPVIDREKAPMTKKADRESGEDQKERW